MSIHTPGPWQFEPPQDESEDGGRTTHYWSIRAPGSFPVLSYELARISGWHPRTDEADARLIAASPDLLDAAKDALCTLEIVGGYGYVLSRLRSAIEKATSGPSQQS